MDKKAREYCWKHPEIREVNLAICRMWEKRVKQFFFIKDGGATILDDGSEHPFRIDIPYERIRRRLLWQTMHSRLRLRTLLYKPKVQCGVFSCCYGDTALCISIMAREAKAECTIFVPLGWKDNEGQIREMKAKSVTATNGGTGGRSMTPESTEP